MVEDNQPVKRRSRLFGGRRSAKKAAELTQPDSASGVPAASETASPEVRPTQSAPTQTTQPRTALTQTAPAQTAPTQTASAPSAAAATDVKVPMTDSNEPNEPWLEPELGQAPAAPSQPVPRTTTSLLFQAPDIQLLPPRPGRERDDDWDRDDRGRDDRDRNDRDSGDAGDRDDRGGDRADTTVRRRTRRRSGDESRLPDDLPPNTVVKVRPPRQQAPAAELITEPQRIKGSTRLEAKKQRRRDGRDAGRRRPVITEAEFLARRESVDRSMIVRSAHDRIQIGVLEDGVLVEHYVAKAQDASLIGNVYLGRVQNVLPSMEAAFVDIGRGRNAVLYSGEVDWDAADTGNQPRRIELALKPGDTVLVQVTKDPVGHKGARLTSQLSLPGRYLVYVPNGNMNGISRKLPDTERARLKKILKEVLPDNVGVIVRTAAEGATEEQLTLDVQRLIEQWSSISDKVKSLQSPALLHGEPDLLVKIIRDVFNEDFGKLVISGSDAQATIETYLAQVAPDLVDRIDIFDGEGDPFDRFRINEQIEKALDRKVWLPSGGSLVIDRTEAMTVVDVNTGKFVGSGGNLEETVTKNNLEAAEEVVRQMRLRDIGGIIVVDFIDMVLESNRDLVLRRLVECLSRDRTKHQVAEVTSLGLVQMTRKKLGLGLLESFSEPCEVCAGRGVIVHHDPTSKHRQTQTPQPEQRRGRKGGQNSNGSNNGGGNGNGNGNGNGSGSGSNGGNGGNGSANGSAFGNGTSNGSHPAGVTHSITPAAQTALAKIAASTIASAAGQKPAVDVTLADSAAVAEAALQGTLPTTEAVGSEPGVGAFGETVDTAEAETSQRSRRSSRRSRSQRAAASAEAANEDRATVEGAVRGPADEAVAAPELTAPELTAPEPTPAVSPEKASTVTELPESDETPDAALELPIIDLPSPPRAPQRAKREDAARLLDSVLEALPEPKQPGQGRSRSRRVSTAALSAPVTAEGE
ncbi:ribonuclease E/G [Subtercola boreus]|uniref:Ribonuclease E n=1 Tax=Subtercola boreus TaxID=120213 RepID=A0A3E0W273_9MICO|nr:Rne/Rng family ribonuclease [Subtercola boreus]RFA15879.1 ribonuclease E/G [Subtercola boreus]